MPPYLHTPASSPEKAGLRPDCLFIFFYFRGTLCSGCLCSFFVLAWMSFYIASQKVLVGNELLPRAVLVRCVI